MILCFKECPSACLTCGSNLMCTSCPGAFRTGNLCGCQSGYYDNGQLDCVVTNQMCHSRINDKIISEDPSLTIIDNKIALQAFDSNNLIAIVHRLKLDGKSALSVIKAFTVFLITPDFLLYLSQN